MRTRHCVPTWSHHSYEVAWDSVTLRKMKRKIIAQCAEQGLDWSRTVIAESDLKPAEAGDTEADVRQRLFGLELYASWHTPHKLGRSK